MGTRCKCCGRLKAHFATGVGEAKVGGQKVTIEHRDSGVCMACRDPELTAGKLMRARA